MKKSVLLVLMIGLVAMTGAVALGWNVVFGGSKQTDKHIPLEDVTELKASLELDAGELELSGGADDLMEAEFLTSEKPNVDFKNKNGVGELKISDKSEDKLFTINNNEEEWEVMLNNDIPTDLDIRTGASSSEIHLAGMNITGFDLKSGVGETTLDLRGDWEKGFHATIDLGVGKTEIMLPEAVGVKVTANKGIGNIDASGLNKTSDGYVNDSYESAEVKITLNVNMGVGELIIR